MMERILKLKEPVLSTLVITNNDLNCITEDEWRMVSSACEFLKIFYELTTEMSAENVVTISKQNLFHLFLQEHLRKFVFNIRMQREIIAMAQWDVDNNESYVLIILQYNSYSVRSPVEIQMKL